MKLLKTTAYNDLSRNLAENPPPPPPNFNETQKSFRKRSSMTLLPSKNTQNKLFNGIRISFGLFNSKFDPNFVYFVYAI